MALLCLSLLFLFVSEKKSVHSQLSDMPAGANLLFLSLLCLLFFFNSGGDTSSDELQILWNLKNSLQNPNTNVFDSWVPNNNVCNFTGITCDHLNGLVQEIELSHQKLTGSVPFDSICSLKSLTKLSLGYNTLSGQVTKDLNKCVGLKYLDVGNNPFSGEFPDVSSLSGLETLYLNRSGLSGTFPWNSLQNMTGLTILSVGDNPFDKTPFPGQVVQLTKLNWLYLANCRLERKIPTGIGNLTELINLELSQNYIWGEIPAEITRLSNLRQLEVYMNELSGTLPVGFGNLTRLVKFDASTNHLSGDLSELRLLNQLQSIQMYKNMLTGEIPAEFGGFKHLMNLSLYNNMLTGPLPQKLGSWADFNFIDVSENGLTGPIPPEMCKNGKMTALLILHNKFTGEIPANYATCSSLTRFRVTNNSLSGVVPAGIWGLPNAEIIDIAMNEFQGRITPDIGKSKSLGNLLIANNKLSGDLPLEISGAASLMSIDLSYNQFSGEIPSTIGELKQLQSIHFENNMFSGSIPDSLGSCHSLSDLNMANNSLSGPIPSSLGLVLTLNSINLSENQLSGRIPSSLSSLKLSLLDLSKNRLTGPIPQSLSIEAYNGSFDGNDGLCSQNRKYIRRCSSESRKSRELHAVIICFTVGLVAMLVSFACFCYVKRSQKHQECENSLRKYSWDVKSFHLLTFTENEILDSIKQENLIGKGGSGNVYKVLLLNGIELAVKHIWNSDGGNGRKKTRSTSPMLGKRPGKSREFDAEVETLSSIRHVNVVKLYCSITSEDSSLLVYEYLPNGSLWDRLHTRKKIEMDWDTRHEIAVGAAKGLEYLHHGCERPVIHRDVKSSNILLDEFLKPRIADFGLAKIVQANATKDSTHVIAGTHGYIAPEYGYTYKVNEKSDVYSFGVVLLELVTGKRPIEPEYGENKDIVYWVSSNLKNKESLLSIVDPDIEDPYKEEAIRVLKIAILCTAKLPALRPTMRTVVQMLVEAEPCKLLGVIVSKNSGSEKQELRDSGKF